MRVTELAEQLLAAQMASPKTKASANCGSLCPGKVAIQRGSAKTWHKTR
jgi:hypothetical protein